MTLAAAFFSAHRMNSAIPVLASNSTLKSASSLLTREVPILSLIKWLLFAQLRLQRDTVCMLRMK
jgi:hypothetical protein